MTTLDTLIERLEIVSIWLGKIQGKLDFVGWRLYPQFADSDGFGRIALIAVLLGIVLGIHILLAILLSLSNLGLESWFSELRISMIWQWCIYVSALCIFHLLEFFTTAVYNPTVTSGDSFLVNHSKAYTAAVLVASTEFWFKFLFLPSSYRMFCCFSILLIAITQTIRSLAMITCGESFNHFIQRSKKDNHVLVTHGVYQYFRHPSYVGFYYWSISTQLVLGNWISAVFFAVASWMFFKRRIPYEEESLFHHFPEEYPAYAKRTWVGIPFVPNCPEFTAVSDAAQSDDSDETTDSPDENDTTDSQHEKTN